MIKIGDFAKLFNVSIKTIRFYEEKGLIKPAFVDFYSSYRYYDENNINQMSKIIYLKNLGLSIKEIKEFNNELIDKKIKEYENNIQKLYKNIDTLKLLSNNKEGDDTMKSFINDERVIGKWNLIGVYSNIEDYNNNKFLEDHNYIINNLYLMPEGKEYWVISWTKDILYICGNPCPYEIKDNKMIVKNISPIFQNDYMIVVYEKENDYIYNTEDFIIKDNLDIKFTSDNRVVGLWKSVEILNNIDNFDGNNIYNNDNLYLKKLAFYPDNTLTITYSDNTKTSKYTKDYVLNLCCNNTLSNYIIKENNGKTYMIIEWKSGDYIYGNIINCYYVLEKIN